MTKRPGFTYSCGFFVTAFLVLCCFVAVSATKCPSLLASDENRPAATKDGDAKEKSYIIGAGDILEVLVWKEPDLSRTVSVRPDGKISLPLVDDVRAAGSTLLEVKARITKALADYVEAPSVYVMLQENRSKRYYLVGNINAPGEYILEKDMSVLQAIAKANGLGEWANEDEIIILRRGAEGEFQIEFDYKSVVSGEDIEQNILLKADDVIIVP